MPPIKDPIVGQLNPSQLLYTYGIGALVDLPHISAIVTGLEDWPTDPSVAKEIVEPRLLLAVRAELGGQVKQMLFPPIVEEAKAFLNPFDEEARVGVPVATFPRWLVCPTCRLLAPIKSGLFELKTSPYHPDRTHYEHINCNKSAKSPTVVPARFVVACERGHLDDFPWHAFVHQGSTPCPGPLRLSEYGPSGEARDLEVRCGACNASRRLAEAFGRENRDKMPLCRGRRPHLRDYDPDGCAPDMHLRPLALGASNIWFSATLSSISVPEGTSKIELLVEENWATLQHADTFDNLQLLHRIGQLGAFTTFALNEIWTAIQRRRAADQAHAANPSDIDLRPPEWLAFSQPDPALKSADFQLRVVEPPPKFARTIAQVVLAERLRAVEALIGFTRVDSPAELEDPNVENQRIIAPLARKSATWVPAVEVRGEGIFIRFDETRLQPWLKQLKVIERDTALQTSHRSWRQARYLEPPDAAYPGIRYALLHSFAHALMRQVALECGYTAASLRERIYSREPNEPHGPMAGILIYTAAPDSEGTLGGLVSLGEPHTLERHIEAALEAAQLCASDPTCAEHHPSPTGIAVHGAACHACLFASETSCERGNRYLDRSLLVSTVDRDDLAFFSE
jgi:hypothetical protein